MDNKNKPKGRKMHEIDTAFDPVAAALKQMHEAVANEAVPDDFLRILEEIDAKIAAGKTVQ
jgi:predicted transcriptional regulator